MSKLHRFLYCFSSEIRATSRNTSVGIALLLVLIWIAALASTAQEERGGCTAGEVFPPHSTQMLEVDGLARYYELHIPPTYGMSRPQPTALVMSFHAASFTAGMDGLLTGWPYLAGERGYITVIPEGINHQWNDGSIADPAIQAVDDVKFARAILDDMSARLCIDQSRIFASGVSAGGGFVQKLVCAIPERIAAVGIVSIRYAPEAMNCDSGIPRPVILFHGTEDPVAPFAGGRFPDPSLSTFDFLAVEEAAALWAEKNGCGLEPITEQISESVQSVRYGNCDNDADVVLYIVEGGGHAWPGSAVDLQRLMPFLGETTQEINATILMWKFFGQHQMADTTQD